jgi:hypothetical protein
MVQFSSRRRKFLVFIVVGVNLVPLNIFRMFFGGGLVYSLFGVLLFFELAFYLRIID